MKPYVYLRLRSYLTKAVLNKFSTFVMCFETFFGAASFDSNAGSATRLNNVKKCPPQHLNKALLPDVSKKNNYDPFISPLTSI